MVRKHYFLRNNQVKALEQITKDGTSEAEHVRIALDDYIEKKLPERSPVSSSASHVLEGGGTNGKEYIPTPPAES
jgi:hypothetical protein